MEYGKMVNRTIEVEDGGIREALVIKETTLNALVIGDSPTLEARVIIFEDDNVHGKALLLLVRLQENDSLIYTTWANHKELRSKRLLDMLQHDDEIYITINTDDLDGIFTFKFKNSLKFITKSFMKEKTNASFSLEKWREFVAGININEENKKSLFNECKYYEI